MTPIETDGGIKGSNEQNKSEMRWSGERSKWGKSKVAPLADSVALPYPRPRVRVQGVL